MWRVLTTPKLVCLPKHPEKLLRTSFCCQKDPGIAPRLSLRNPPGECSPWATSIRNRSREPQGPRLIFGQADLEQRRAGPRGREGTPRRKRDAGHLRPAPLACSFSRVSFATPTPRSPAPPRSGRARSGWRCAGGRLARRRRSRCTRWRACGRGWPRASPPDAAPCPCRRRA